MWPLVKTHGDKEIVGMIDVLSCLGSMGKVASARSPMNDVFNIPGKVCVLRFRNVECEFV